MSVPNKKQKCKFNKNKTQEIPQAPTIGQKQDVRWMGHSFVSHFGSETPVRWTVTKHLQ